MVNQYRKSHCGDLMTIRLSSYSISTMGIFILASLHRYYKLVIYQGGNTYKIISYIPQRLQSDNVGHILNSRFFPTMKMIIKLLKKTSNFSLFFCSWLKCLIWNWCYHSDHIDHLPHIFSVFIKKTNNTTSQNANIGNQYFKFCKKLGWTCYNILLNGKNTETER